MDKRPVSVTIIAAIYLAVGTIGFVYHLSECFSRHQFGYDSLLVEIVEAVAILSGAFLLRGHNWARWLAMVWIASHVVLSAFRALSEFAVHAVFCALIASVLFRPAASRYFRRSRVGSTASV